MQTKTKARLLDLYRYLHYNHPNPKFKIDKQGRWMVYLKCLCGKPEKRRTARINRDGAHSLIMCKLCRNKFMKFLKTGKYE